MNRRIYLASTSPRRYALLASLGLDFSVLSVPVDETLPAVEPEKAVEIVAARKARAVAERLEEAALVIGADTIVVHQGKTLGKPPGPGSACEMLRRLQGDCHTVFTGVAVTAVPEGKTAVAHAATRVCFAPLSEEEIAAYVATGEPLDKAGAYAAQGLGAVFIRRIEGCYLNVVGLPLSLLCEMLKGFGLNLLLVCGAQKDEG
ncbi:MAG TPA: septum formation inhibitor Maf [Desulfotomaculum sp.]|nr:septum formation inhibitor Maf [Desulfotomaculum sp.]